MPIPNLNCTALTNVKPMKAKETRTSQLPESLLQEKFVTLFKRFQSIFEIPTLKLKARVLIRFLDPRTIGKISTASFGIISQPLIAQIYDKYYTNCIRFQPPGTLSLNSHIII